MSSKPLPPAEAPPAVEQGFVLRGVAIGQQERTLTRPRPAAVQVPVPAPNAWPRPAAAGGRAVASLAREEAKADMPPRAAPAMPQGPEVSAREQQRGYEAGYGAGFEEGRAKGHAQGYESGHAEGLVAGRESGHAEASETVLREGEHSRAAARQAVEQCTQRLDALIASLSDRFEAHLAAGEDDMLALCFEALGRILGQMSARDGTAAALVRQALADARMAGSLAVHVHPDDLELLRSDAALAEWLGAGRRVQWVADEQVTLGGCVVASAQGTLDARLETQLARMAALFLDARAEGKQA